VILFVVSSLRIICLVPFLIVLKSLYVMHVPVLRLISYLIQFRQVAPPLLWSLFIQMFGIVLLILLVGKNIMSVSLMIIVNSLGFTCSNINLRSSHISLNFKSLLNACLIAGLSLFNLTREGSMRNCIPFSIHRDISSRILPTHTPVKWGC
jgi:hypothetical protein